VKRPPRDREALHRRVRELVDQGAIDAPDDGPTYVQNPGRPGEGAGWCWTYHGRREVLGTNVFLALQRLDELAHATA
jgi:hypothetical protein